MLYKYDYVFHLLQKIIRRMFHTSIVNEMKEYIGKYKYIYSWDYSIVPLSVSIEPLELNSKHFDFEIINGRKYYFTKPEQMPKWELNDQIFKKHFESGLSKQC